MSMPSAGRSSRSCTVSSRKSAPSGHCDATSRSGTEAGKISAIEAAVARSGALVHCLLADEIQRGERNVCWIVRKYLAGPATTFLDGLDADCASRQVAQRPQSSLADHALGDLGYDAKHPGHAAFVVVHRTVRERVVGLFRKAATLEKEQ